MGMGDMETLKKAIELKFTDGGYLLASFDFWFRTSGVRMNGFLVI
jgi:hypothetical protein